MDFGASLSPGQASGYQLIVCGPYSKCFSFAIVQVNCDSKNELGPGCQA